MWIPITSLLLIAEIVLAASNSFIIKLDGEKTFEDYLQQSIADALNIKPSSDNTIEIGSFKAFVADFEDDLLDQLKADPIINDVFENVDISLLDEGAHKLRKRDVLSPPLNSKFTKRADVTTQSNAPRHLARLSSREGIYNKDPPYEYKYDSDGSGITAYVLDTGVAIDNPDFEGRASHGQSFIDGEEDGDGNGHGTNVAGIVGSKTYGVAKGVDIVDVKILGASGRGSLAGILRGLEWANNDRKSKNKKAVANMSVGAGKNNAVNQAVNAAVSDGLAVFVAAGNANNNALLYSPASASEPITVGALDDKTDTIGIFSNWGPRIDIFASGAFVESLSNTNFDQTSQWIGTSQATPSVCGLGAILMQKGFAVSQLKDQIIKLSTKNAISQETYDHNSNYTDTVNRNLYNGIVDSPDKISDPSHEEQDMSLLKYIEL